MQEDCSHRRTALEVALILPSNPRDATAVLRLAGQIIDWQDQSSQQKANIIALFKPKDAPINGGAIWQFGRYVGILVAISLFSLLVDWIPPKTSTASSCSAITRDALD